MDLKATKTYKQLNNDIYFIHTLGQKKEKEPFYLLQPKNLSTSLEKKLRLPPRKKILRRTVNFTYNSVKKYKKEKCSIFTEFLITDEKKLNKFYQMFGVSNDLNNLKKFKIPKIKNKIKIDNDYNDEEQAEQNKLSSTLSKDYAEILINESLKENYGYINFEDTKLLIHESINICFKCIFCQVTLTNLEDFYNHISFHTGEFRYKCNKCDIKFRTNEELELHMLEHSFHIKEEDYEFDNFEQFIMDDKNTYNISCTNQSNNYYNNKLFGYMCAFCYYVQLEYNNIEKHMLFRHLKEDKKPNGYYTVIRINMCAGNENNQNINCTIDYTNLIGCIPPDDKKPNICTLSLI